MKTPPVSLLLGVCVLLLSGLRVSAVSLSLSPNLQQFFVTDSVSLSCVGDGQTADGQTVKRTTGGQTDPCGSGFGTFDGSSCTVPVLSPSDSGVYWCETSSGQSSLQVNISVTSSTGRLILEIPALPVLTGRDVTLRCRNKDKKRVKAFFFRGGVHLGSGPDGGFTISRVQQSDEGLYSCSTTEFGSSPQSWLRVRDPPRPPSSPPPPPPPSSPPSSPPPPPPPPPCVSVVRLLCLLLVFSPFCISTGLLVSIYFSRKTGNKPAVSMEMSQTVGGGQGLADEYDDITADVTTEHEF